MARRSLSSNFRSDARLQQYFLDKVVPTGKALGSGSYGTVFEVSNNILLMPIDNILHITVVRLLNDSIHRAG